MLKSGSSLTELVYGQVSNDSWLTRFFLPDVKFETISKHHRFYSSQYSKIAEQLTPLQALSTLSLNRVELERICLNRQKELYNKAGNMLSADERNRIFVVEVAYSTALDKRELQLQEGEEGMFSAEENFKANILPYLKTDSESDSEIYNLYATVENYFQVAWKLEPLEKIIATVIDLGYPIVINQELDRKAYQNRNTGGRPQDESADQEDIISKVAELSKMKRFQKTDGTPKPTTIRDEILNKYPELAGEISDRALFNRVKKALVVIGMK